MVEFWYWGLRCHLHHDGERHARFGRQCLDERSDRPRLGEFSGSRRRPGQRHGLFELAHSGGGVPPRHRLEYRGSQLLCRVGDPWFAGPIAAGGQWQGHGAGAGAIGRLCQRPVGQGLLIQRGFRAERPSHPHGHGKILNQHRTVATRPGLGFDSVGYRHQHHRPSGIGSACQHHRHSGF